MIRRTTIQKELIPDAVNQISESSQSTANIASEVSKAHENLTSTIIEVSDESSKIMEDIKNCEKEFQQCRYNRCRIGTY